MRQLRALAAVAGLAMLAACGSPSAPGYDGPQVTRIYVEKGARKMHLLSGNTILHSYDIALGFAPEGDKKVEGDGRTPEGTYMINRRNPNSLYHLSLGISYPDQNDYEEAVSMGARPGGDIFIHGTAGKDRGLPRDWTAGCIAVQDVEIEEIWAMVRDGTLVTIVP